MLIYVDQISERLLYTLHFVFDMHACKVNLTNDKVLFQEAKGNKLNYSTWPLDDVPQLIPAQLLFDEAIDHQLMIETLPWNEIACLAFNGTIDPLAAIFYVLTRYEEYTAQRLDKHGRFEAKNSIQARNGWLQQQIVERWIVAFFNQFAPENIPVLDANKDSLFIPSFDIDNTFAFQWKEGWRTWLSNAKDLVKQNNTRKTERKLVQEGKQKDPFDCYDFFKKVAISESETRFFWLLGDFAEYDKNLSWSDPRHQALIQSFHEIAKVGLHPSYASNQMPRKLAVEKDRLKQITGSEPTESRQHFLKLRIPITYRKLIEQGFERDFTMGFAEEPGFRAGTARPHFFFDIEQNCTTDLEIIPFAYMDGTLNEYLGLSIEEAKLMVNQLVNEVKQYGGNFCCVWHNETIAEAGKWKGWRSVFEHTQNQFKSE
jgi:hypothetical protein